MDIQINLHIPPHLTSQAQSIENIEQYANQALIDALQRESEKHQFPNNVSNDTRSKWAKLVDEIEKMNIPSDVFEHMRACSQEFRNDFAFKHDFEDQEV